MKNISLYNKIFFIFVTVLVLSISFIAFYGYKSTSEAYIESAYDSSYQNARTIEVKIEGKLANVPKDVIFATDFYALKKFMIWRSMGEYSKAAEWKQTFSDTLLDFLYTKKNYYQARVIDLDGNELINAQYIAALDKTILVKDLDLQNKKGRDYVEETKKLKKGEFHISSMILNIKNAKIEVPYIPVIRYSTPIFGIDEKVVAIFVVNFYAQSILDILENKTNQDESKSISYYLVNKNGEYLYHKNKAKRWASQLKKTYSFNKEHFHIKKVLKNKEHGSFSLNSKIYSFHEVQPFLEHPNDFLYIVSSVDESVALSKLDKFRLMYVILIILVVFLSFYIIRFFILKITTPLTQVTNQLSALSRGEIKKEDIDYSSNDEVGNIVASTKKVVYAIEKTINQANKVASGELDKDIELLSENDKLGSAINNMTMRLREIESLAQNLSEGNYNSKIVANSSNDKLGLALIDMVKYLEKVTQIAELVSKGKIDINYKAVGDEDRLGIAMLKMIAYLKTILKQANSISKEDFSQVIKAKSHHDELSTAMITMTSILSKNYKKNKEEIYFNEGIGDFSDKLTGIDNEQELAQEAISMLSRYVEASSGIIYTYDSQKETLNLMASFAHTSKKDSLKSFKLGEGVVGQVGLDKKRMLIKNITDDAYQIESGTSLGLSKEVFVFPLMHEGKLFGVAEIMSFNKFTKIHIDYLLKAAGIFATALHLTIQNVQIKVLLEKSQRAFEELQTQSEELQESNVQMEEQQQQLREQSAELRGKNETLAQAKEEIDKRADDLERASNYKSEFLANMSHELRTPLNSIILLSKLLSQNKADNLNIKDIDKANIINKSGNDLLLLINDILDLTKIESGNMELELSEVYSGDLVEEMKGLFAAMAQDKNIEFDVKDTFNSKLMIDSLKLSQVLKNLLSNSIKFTQNGRVSLYIYQDEKNLKILVKDTGIGIPQDKLNTIFEAFKQVDGSISREFGGTGLGLSITKTIVDLMGGEISVESVLGEGTSINVSLPINNNEAKIIIPQTTNEKILSMLEEELDEDYFQNELEGKNILIVDDDSRNIFTLTSVLESSGVEIYSAFNGQEAIDFLTEENERIDLILMDIMMPVMDGLTAIESIKSDEKFKEIPIIAITAKTTAEDKQKCLDAGADEYLAKPIEHNALFAIIKAWIS